MEQFNITMRKYLKEVGVTAQQAIERVVREEKLAGKGKLKVKMVLTSEGTNLRHVVEGEIDLADAHDTYTPLIGYAAPLAANRTDKARQDQLQAAMTDRLESFEELSMLVARSVHCFAISKNISRFAPGGNASAA